MLYATLSDGSEVLLLDPETGEAIKPEDDNGMGYYRLKVRKLIKEGVGGKKIVRVVHKIKGWEKNMLPGVIFYDTELEGSRPGDPYNVL